MDEIINRLKKVRRGAMFIIEAPSGTGKSAVVKEILKRDSNIKFSVSVTTRKPRENEVDGVDYYYVTNEQYDEFLAQDAFYEHVESQYGDRYGTLRSEVDSFINIGQDVMFDMDWPAPVDARKSRFGRRFDLSASAVHQRTAPPSGKARYGFSGSHQQTHGHYYGQDKPLGRVRLCDCQCRS